MAQTEPEHSIPSKNHDPYLVNPSISCIGEYTKIPAKNPNQVLKHMGQLVISLMNAAKEFKGKLDSDHFLIPSLGPLNILPYTTILVIP
jgi:hypothetical protein